MKCTAGNLAPRRRSSTCWVLGALLLAGCMAERETTISRSARQREFEAEKSEREHQRRELEVLRHQVNEEEAAIRSSKAESVRLAMVVRATHQELLQQLGRLKDAEQDLATVRQRGLQIEAELVPLRALEQTLQELPQRRAAAEQQLAALQAEVAAAEQAIAAKNAELQPRLQQLQQQLAAAQQVAKAIGEAQTVIGGAAATLSPPAAAPVAPVAPAAPAAAQPKK